MLSMFWRNKDKYVKVIKMKKILYKRAIDGYQQHHRNFNHWMNMYAIFNGALFVGYYKLQSVESCSSHLFKLIILLLGCVAGWCWLFSVCGFYRWIISWIGVVRKFETQLNASLKPYEVFVHNITETEHEKFYYKPFSTQKLTIAFTSVVALAWTTMLCFFVYGSNITCYCKLSLGIAILLFVAFFILICNLFCREDLKYSHKHL